MIVTQITLVYFDRNKETTIQVDASSRGVGAVLLQYSKPVAFAIKSLTETECRYANIQRQLLAVVYGCERFHTYIYGSNFVVETDHKPTLVADAMLRLPNNRHEHIDLDIKLTCVQFSSDKPSQLQQETKKDNDLSTLRESIIDCWPDSMKQMPTQLRQYWSYRDELLVENDMLLKDKRLVIPRSMQQDLVSMLDTRELKSVNCARSCVFWTSMNTDIDKVVHQCATCQEYQYAQPAETLRPHEIPTRPWQDFRSDLFYFDGHDHLIVSDYYSKFPIVRKITMEMVPARL